MLDNILNLSSEPKQLYMFLAVGITFGSRVDVIPTLPMIIACSDPSKAVD